MKFFANITTIIKRITAKDIPGPLGRWKNENCNIKMINKIDMSNEDHCGPCGEYALDKIKKDSIKDNELIKSK